MAPVAVIGGASRAAMATSGELKNTLTFENSGGLRIPQDTSSQSLSALTRLSLSQEPKGKHTGWPSGSVTHGRQSMCMVQPAVFSNVGQTDSCRCQQRLDLLNSCSCDKTSVRASPWARPNQGAHCVMSEKKKVHTCTPWHAFLATLECSLQPSLSLLCSPKS